MIKQNATQIGNLKQAFNHELLSEKFHRTIKLNQKAQLNHILI